MSGSKVECDSFSVRNDAPVADKAGTIGDNTGAHEVSFVEAKLLGGICCVVL